MQFQKDTKDWLKGLGYGCLLTLVVLLFYWESLGAYFNGNDMIWGVAGGPWWDPGSDTWRPLPYALHHLISACFELNPLPHRLLSLIVYICILLLLYRFYNLLLDNKTLSKIAVLLFACFYLNIHSVTIIVNFREILLVFFSLATIVCFIHYKKAWSLRYYALALLFATLAASSKETAIFLPVFLLAVDYYISHGIFPPKVPSLTEVRRCLLPHLPFLLGALALLILVYIRPGHPIRPSTHLVPGQGIPASTYLWNIYSFIIYSFSPCFITDRFTIILALSILAGLGWLFYRSTPQKRSLIITLIACTGVSFFPYVPVGVIPRYTTFPAVFSMFLVALLAFEIGLFLHRLLEGKGYRLSPDLTAASLALLLLMPAIYLNYKFIKQYTWNVVYAGKFLRETVEGTIKILPLKSKESPIIYINLPCAVLSNLPPPLTIVFSTWSYRYIISRYDPNLEGKAFLVDLGYNDVKLPYGAWYTLAKELPGQLPTLSAEEYNTLSKDEKNKLLFFNPINKKLVDVSGWSYQELKESLAPYRDKLNYVPPIKNPFGVRGM